MTRGTRPKKPSSSRGFAREAHGAQGVWGFWGLKTENCKLFSFQAGQIYLFILFFILFYFILFFSRVRADVAQRPHGRRGVFVGIRAPRGCGADAPHPHGRINASARTRFLPRPPTVKTRSRIKPRPRGKHGRRWTS
jgi:hypothetical protein